MEPCPSRDQKQTAKRCSPTHSFNINDYAATLINATLACGETGSDYYLELLKMCCCLFFWGFSRTTTHLQTEVSTLARRRQHGLLPTQAELKLPHSSVYHTYFVNFDGKFRFTQLIFF